VEVDSLAVVEPVHSLVVGELVRSLVVGQLVHSLAVGQLVRSLAGEVLGNLIGDRVHMLVAAGRLAVESQAAGRHAPPSFAPSSISSS